MTELLNAIELNQQSEQSLRQHKFIEHADAINLGIEALKRVQRRRELRLSYYMAPLPGETPEPPPSDSLTKPEETG